MKIQTVSALLLLLALCYIANAASEVFIDDSVRSRSIFSSLLIGTIITSIAAIAIDIDVP